MGFFSDFFWPYSSLYAINVANLSDSQANFQAIIFCVINMFALFPELTGGSVC